MPTPFLLTNPTTGTPRGKRSVTGVATDQGVVFGPAAEALTLSNSFQAQCQRIIRFRGYDTWVVAQTNSILRSTDAGASYSTVFGPDTDLGDTGKAGPFLSYPGGVATLSIIAAPSAGSNSFRLFTSTDGITWAKSAILLVVGGVPNGAFTSVTFWRGSFYAQFQASGLAPVTIVWDPGSMTVASIAEPVLSALQGTDLCVLDDRLFAAFHDSGGIWRLYELVGGSWTFRATIFSTGGLGAGSMGALFVDQATGDLGFLGGNTTGPSVIARRINISTFVVTDPGTTITDAFGTVVTSARFRWILDLPDSTGLYIYYRSPASTDGPYTLYRWNGFTSTPTSLGSGGDRSFAYPWGVQNGGSVFWTSGQRHIERLTATAALGGVQYGFQIYSPYPSVDTVSVRWVYGNNIDESPHTPYASLTSPSAGSISGGNTITGLDAADNGATTFTVIWQAQADGFAVGDFAKTTPEIFS